MKRLLIIIPAAILLLFLALGAWLFLFFDANDYREQISKGFKDATGHEISIKGDLNTSFFPWIGIETGAIEVANAPGFGDAPLAAIKGSNIHLKLLPLFSGEIEMETVVLDGLQANLVTLANGKSNWNFSETADSKSNSPRTADASGTDSAQKSAKKTSEDAPAPADNPLAALAIGGIEMNDAQVTWDDRKGGTKIALTQMNLDTGAIAFDAPIDVAFDTAFAMNGEEMKGKLQAATDLELSADLQTVKLNGLKLDIDATGSSLENGSLKTSLKSDILVDRAAEKISSDKISIALNLAGSVAPVNPMAVTLDSPLKINLASMVIELPTMSYSIPGSQGAGSLTLSKFDKPMPAVKLTLQTDKLDLTPYVAAPAQQAGLQAPHLEPLLLKLVSIHSASASPKSEPVDIPVETIRQLDVDADLAIATFVMEGLQATDVKAKLKANKGVVRVEPMTANLFGGSASGLMELDARGETPIFHLKEDLENVQIAQVMKYSMGEDSKDWITGIANMQSDIRTQGKDTGALTQALNGLVNVKLKDGAFEGFSVRKMLRKANALLKGEPYADDGSPDRTKILELGTNTKLVNGVAVTDNIKVLTPLADLTGNGSANLVSEQLDYRLKLALSSGISEIDKAEFKKLEGRALPLKVSGNFSDPKFNLDMDKAAKEEVKNKAEKKLRKKYGEKYGKELDMLFGK